MANRTANNGFGITLKSTDLHSFPINLWIHSTFIDSEGNEYKNFVSLKLSFENFTNQLFISIEI